MEFESPFQNKWIICRTCLKSSELEMTLIFENTENLHLKIEEIGGVKLDSGVDLPDSICHKCLTLLKAALKFRTMCQKSQKELSEQFGQLETIESEESPQESRESNIQILNRSVEVSIGDESKTTNTEKPLADDREALVYSFEYHDSTELLDVDSPAVLEDEAPFEVLKEDNETQYAESEMENLELVLSLDGDKGVSSFKIVPQFSTSTSTRTTRQYKRKTNGAQNTKQIHVCPYCGNNYPEKAKLSLHMKIHSKEKPHQCEICLKRFSQTPQLARHMNSHTGSRPFLCKFCQTGFSDPSTRIKHERTHTNERPYKCELCPKAFAYSNVLKVHIMTHTGEKPYACAVCGKRFSQAHHKRNHERLCTSLKLLKPVDYETL